MRGLFRGVLIPVLLVGASPALAAAQFATPYVGDPPRHDLSGIYEAAGGPPDSPYAGKVKFDKRKTVTLPGHGKIDIWDLTWTVTISGQEYKFYGVGTLWEDWFFAAYDRKGSHADLWVYKPLGLSQQEKAGMIRSYNVRRAQLEQKIEGREGAYIQDRSLFASLAEDDVFLAYSFPIDDRYRQMLTANGSNAGITGAYRSHGIWLTDDGKSRDVAGPPTRQIDITADGVRLDISWGRGKEAVTGAGFAIRPDAFVAMQGGSSDGGILVYRVREGKFVGKYTANGEGYGVYDEVLTVPDDVKARAPKFFEGTP